MAHARSAAFGDQLGQAVQGLRAEYYIHIRRTLHNRLAFLRCDTTTHANNDIGIGEFQLSDAAKISYDPARSNAPYRIFNIGNHAPIPLMGFIDAIEQAVGIEAIKNFMPLQDGDVPATHADVEELTAWTGFKPEMPVPEGVRRFVAWYRDYFKV